VKSPFKSATRAVAGALAATLIVALVPAGAAAQQYPSQPIRLIVPWPAGGTTDVLARLLAQNLTGELGQTVFVENIGGVGGNVGTQRFVKAKPDGYTLLMASSSTNAANPHLYKNLGFEPIKDFTPIALVALVPSVMVVAAHSPLKSVKDLLDADRAKPGQLFYASAGVGSSAHLAGELLKSLTRISATHAPYKGIAPAMVDVMSGRVDYTFDTGVSGNIENGKVRPLAVASARRVDALPQVPTFEEAGIKGMYMSVWFGIAGPGGMPRELAGRLNSAINVSLGKGELPQRLGKLGSDAQATSLDAFSEFWRSELNRYADIVRLSGATLD
jgi:tripartite-type tricarboxylate transporter receptor subunit TctC